MKATVNYEAPVEPKVESVTIELTPDEAEFLAVVMYRVGGNIMLHRTFCEAMREAGIGIHPDYRGQFYARGNIMVDRGADHA